jgi:hypothetical protein
VQFNDPATGTSKPSVDAPLYDAIPTACWVQQHKHYCRNNLGSCQPAEASQAFPIGDNHALAIVVKKWRTFRLAELTVLGETDDNAANAQVKDAHTSLLFFILTECLDSLSKSLVRFTACFAPKNR